MSERPQEHAGNQPAYLLGAQLTKIASIEELEKLLAAPSPALVDDLSRLDGDLMLLGAGGKMGPSMALLARNALDAAGSSSQVIAVSRFSDEGAERRLQDAGVRTVRADLLDDEQLSGLPEAANVVYMAAMKFGSTGQEPLTWAMNTYLPGKVAERYRDSRIVAFSTGNVYPLSPLTSGGPTEDAPTGPIGEYAQSCLGRERMFQHFSLVNGTPVVLLRLNYAVELRYGVLVDLAQAVRDGQPIDLAMSAVNVIWQGDANEASLRALAHCSSPATIINLTGPETASVRKLATALGQRLGKEPVFVGEEQATALLNDAAKAHALFGYPKVTLNQAIDWVADWVGAGGETHGKPTKFQVRTGKF